VNFNVNFNVLLSKYIVHPLVKIKETSIITKSSERKSEVNFSITLTHSLADLLLLLAVSLFLFNFGKNF